MAKKRKTELDIDIVEEEEPAEEAEAPPPAEEEKAPDKDKEKKPFIHPSIIKLAAIAIAVLLLLAGIGFGIKSFLEKKEILKKEELKKQEELKRQEKLKAQIPKLPIFSLERFFIPLKEKEGEEKFLSLVVSVELTSEDVHKELTKVLASIREAIFFYLSGKSAADVYGKEKMFILEKDLKVLISRNLQSGAVKKVYFQEYVVQ